MKLAKVHRVLTFTQTDWMRSYIEYNTEMRKLATNVFAKNFFKLMNNACFGKTMENVKVRSNIQLITDAKRFLTLVSKPQLETFKILNENTVLINRIKLSVLLDKPIYARFCILEISKVLMYNFHYDVIVKRYGDNARLLFTDTDSLCYCITTNNLYEDLIDINDEWLDTSEYPKDHPLYSARNAMVLGKMKDECAGDYVEEFVGLRSKIYSLLACIPTHSKKTAKCRFLKKHVKHAMFKKTLIDSKCTYANFVSFRSR